MRGNIITRLARGEVKGKRDDIGGVYSNRVSDSECTRCD